MKQEDKRTLTLVKIVKNLVQNCLITGYCLKDTLKSLGLDYRDTSPIKCQKLNKETRLSLSM